MMFPEGIRGQEFIQRRIFPPRFAPGSGQGARRGRKMGGGEGFRNGGGYPSAAAR